MTSFAEVDDKLFETSYKRKSWTKESRGDVTVSQKLSCCEIHRGMCRSEVLAALITYQSCCLLCAGALVRFYVFSFGFSFGFCS